jgi:UDP-N-acetylglucosamine acyltransferase
MAIHSTAQVDSRAEIDTTVEIGPFVIVDGPVTIGPRTRIMAHAYLAGRTTIGSDNVIHMGAVIGHEPQDFAFTGEETVLQIGDRNVFREHCEVHRSSKLGSATVIGNDNYLMTHAHVAHDCRIGDHVILATGATLGGHVEVADRAFISGNCVVHQFVRIGRLSMLRGLSRAPRDVPPFVIVDETSTVRALNRVGLRRAGFEPQRIRDLQKAFRHLFRTRRNLRLAMQELESETLSPEVRHLVDFMKSTQRGVSTAPRRGSVDELKVRECE